MLRVKVHQADPTDLFEQVAAEIRRAIADGEAAPESACHRPRTWPPHSGSTPTRSGARCGFRHEGLLEFRRGRGISVTGTPERGAVVQRAREPLEFARKQGYRTDELLEIVQGVIRDGQ